MLSSIVIFSKQIKELAESDIDREGMLILDKYKNECLLKLNEDIALAKESLLNLNGLLQTDLYTNIRDILNQNNIVDQKLNVVPKFWHRIFISLRIHVLYPNLTRLCSQT